MSSSDDIVDNQGICLHFIPKDKNFLCLVHQRPAVIQRCTENEVCWIFCSSAWTISEVQFAGVKEVVRFFFEGHSHAIASACHTCARVWNQNKEFLKKLIEADSSFEWLEEINYSHLECCFAKKSFTRIFFFFVKFLKRNHKANLQLVWGQEVRYSL